ncbi:MAG: potassium channel family protein [Bacteroidota bacterium]
MSIKLPRYDEKHHQRTNNFLWLFLALFGILIFPTFGFLLGHVGTHLFDICYTLVILTGIYIVTDSKKNLFAGLVLGITALVFFIGRHIIVAKATSTAQVCASLLYFAFIGFHLVRILIKSREISLNVLYGAMVGYMLIGIIGGQLCTLLDIYLPNSFDAGGELITPYGYIYFSFVTLTTLGYGDITPQNESARAIAILISIAGQIYLTTLIAILIGKYLSQENKNNSH